MAELSHIHWPAPPAIFSLGAQDVHVWAANLDMTPEPLALCESLLSPDELTRAYRFVFPRDRNRFIAGRGILRKLLAAYVNCHAGQILFSYNQSGKPSLTGFPGGSHIHFNLAHSGDVVVFAISRIPSIGIDVERLRVMDDAEKIAGRFFSAREAATLKALAPSQKTLAFFNLWTRKEAWLKATGEGIGELLNQGEISLTPEEPARLLSVFNDTAAAAEWSLREIQPAPGYVGTLAVLAKHFNLSCWRWQEPFACPSRAFPQPTQPCKLEVR